MVGHCAKESACPSSYGPEVGLIGKLWIWPLGCSKSYRRRDILRGSLRDLTPPAGEEPQASPCVNTTLLLPCLSPALPSLVTLNMRGFEV